MSRLSIRLSRTVPSRNGGNELTSRDADGSTMEFDLTGLPKAIARVQAGDITNVTVIEHDTSVNPANALRIAELLQAKMTLAGAVKTLRWVNPRTGQPNAWAYSIGVREQIGSPAEEWLKALS